jgi:hypothetical protein
MLRRSLVFVRIARCYSNEAYNTKLYQYLLDKLPACGAINTTDHKTSIIQDSWKPIVIKNALEDSLIKKKWTFDYLKENHGHRKFIANAYFTNSANLVTLSEFIDKALQYEPDYKLDSKSAPYLQGWNLRDGGEDSSLVDDLMTCIPRYCENNLLNTPKFAKLIGEHYNRGRYNWCGLFVAATGGRTRLHWDALGSSSALGMLTGYKFVVLFAPEQSVNLYPQHTGKKYPSKLFFEPEMMSQIDIYNVDLQKFPNFRNVKALAGIIGPGDLVIIPPGWWHDVFSLSPSITINYNFVHEHNYGDFEKEYERLSKF